MPAHLLALMLVLAQPPAEDGWVFKAPVPAADTPWVFKAEPEPVVVKGTPSAPILDRYSEFVAKLHDNPTVTYRVTVAVGGELEYLIGRTLNTNRVVEVGDVYDCYAFGKTDERMQLVSEARALLPFSVTPSAVTTDCPPTG